MTRRLNRRTWLGAAAALALPSVASRAQDASAPISISLAPFLSPHALLAAFRPLREHLELALRHPVEMVSARDFRSQADAVRGGRHDAAMLPAHVARLAMLDWNHRLLAATLDSLRVQVLVRSDSPVQQAEALRGQRIGMGDALSLTATVGRQWLREQGLAAAVEVVELPSVNSALHALDRGEVVSVICGDSQLNALPPQTPRNFRVLASIGEIPGPMFVGRPGLPEARREALRAALLSFTPNPARPPTAANAKLHVPDAAQLARLDPLAVIARQVLAGG
ncbi:PhnD/SsuA/transferrin family substrate-binding protein [Variovorax sp. YR752]|uniref:phosphate/phosphite/phosphonate ABC transporter substrate-binding protein n=1 Tax=Variovorax sp. YR752 TaxID=1884383 RepID=UPI0031377196